MEWTTIGRREYNRLNWSKQERAIPFVDEKGKLRWRVPAEWVSEKQSIGERALTKVRELFKDVDEETQRVLAGYLVKNYQTLQSAKEGKIFRKFGLEIYYFQTTTPVCLVVLKDGEQYTESRLYFREKGKKDKPSEILKKLFPEEVLKREKEVKRQGDLYLVPERPPRQRIPKAVRLHLRKSVKWQLGYHKAEEIRVRAVQDIEHLEEYRLTGIYVKGKNKAPTAPGDTSEAMAQSHFHSKRRLKKQLF